MKTPQLPCIIQQYHNLSVKIFAVLFATLAIFHQDIITLAKNPTKQTN